MSKFEYPRLSRHEIVGILAESQIAVISEAELIHPNPDFMFNLYTRILIYIDILKYFFPFKTLTLIFLFFIYDFSLWYPSPHFYYISLLIF